MRGRPNKIHREKKTGAFRVTINGKKHYLGKDRYVALKRFAQLLAESGKPEPASRADYVAELVELWLKSSPSVDRANRLRRFVDWAGEMSLREVSAATLEDYAAWLQKQRYTKATKPDKRAKTSTYAPKTIIDYVAAATACLKWAAKRELISVVPDTPKLDRPVRKPRDVDPARIMSAIESLQGPAAKLVRFIAVTGARPIEARMLRWNEVDLKRGVAVLTEHKTAKATGKTRTIYLTKTAIKILKDQPERTGYVFRSSLGKPYTKDGLRAILQRRGITPYALRHTFAQLASETLSAEDLAKLLGHESTETTKIYYEIRDARARAAARKVTLPF